MLQVEHCLQYEAIRREESSKERLETTIVKDELHGRNTAARLNVPYRGLDLVR